MPARSVKGARVNVKLPWKGVTDNKDQFVRMKRPVARLLGFDVVKTSDKQLLYDTKVQEKDESPTEKKSGFQNVKRIRRSGYRQRSFTVYFEKAQKPQGEGNTLSFQSISFPVTTSTGVYDVVEYFEGSIGKNLTITKLKTDKGATYPINPT